MESLDIERASRDRQPVDRHHEDSLRANKAQASHQPANFHEQWAPRFRQIQAYGPAKQDEEYDSEYDLTWVSKLRRNLREPLAEFLGVFIMICFGDGSVAQVNLSKNEFGEYQSISWCCEYSSCGFITLLMYIGGIGVMFGVYIAGGISGGHLNPAVTLANCVYRRFPWKKLLPYAIAQCLGAFCGAALVYANYKSAIDFVEGGDFRTHVTATVFSTYPVEFLSAVGQFFSEVISTAILIICLFAIGDEKNNPAGDLGPLIIFFLIFGLGAAFGWQTGYALNLARDFGPRLLAFCIGYSSEVWTYGGNYSIIPCTAPFVGALLGGAIYDVLIFTGDSPMNRRHFGLDEWRWKKTLANPIEEISDALPDILKPSQSNTDQTESNTSTSNSGTKFDQVHREDAGAAYTK